MAADSLAAKHFFTARAIGPVPHTVKLATAAALPACTAAGTGVGHTLTANAVGILTVDGVATVLNDRILVKDQSATDDNGIYAVTTAGTAGVAFVLTRATDFDQAAAGEIAKGEAAYATAGATNIGTSWVLTTAGVITVDTTGLTFAASAAPDADGIYASTRQNIYRRPNVAAVVTITETAAPLLGVLRVEVVNAPEQDPKREDAYGTAMPWQLMGGIRDDLGVITVTAGEIIVSGAMEFPLQLQNIGFGFLRFKYVGDTGTGEISIVAAVAPRS